MAKKELQTREEWQAARQNEAKHILGLVEKDGSRKTGYNFSKATDSSASHMDRALDQFLEKLGTDRIDPNEPIDNWAAIIGACFALILAIGIIIWLAIST